MGLVLGQEQLKLNQLLLSQLKLNPMLRLSQQRLNRPKLNQKLLQATNRLMLTQMLALLRNNNHSQMVELEIKAVMTLATMRRTITEAMTLMLEPVLVVLVATRLRSQPSSERRAKEVLLKHSEKIENTKLADMMDRALKNHVKRCFS